MSTLPLSRPGRFVYVAIGTLGGMLTLAGLILLYRINPEESPVFPPCLLHSLTGLFCPGCGATRAVHYLLHGEIGAALAMNPLFVISLPLVFVLFARPSLLRSATFAKAIMYVVLGYFILRNIPVWPLNLLAPHGV